MSCSGDNLKSMTVTINGWSAKSISIPNPFRAVDAIEFAHVKFVRATVQVENNSQFVQARATLRYTNDKLNYDTPIALTSYQSGNGTVYGSWADVTTGAKLFAELNVEVQNSSGTAVEMGQITVRYDFRGV